MVKANSTRHSCRWRRLAGAALAGSTIATVASLGGSPALAALIAVHRMLEVVEVDEEITHLAVGDRFVIEYVVNDAATDTQPSTFTGIFPGLLTSFSMTREPGNAGSWTPSGSFDLVVDATFSTSAPADYFNFRIPGSGFPDGAPDLLFNDLDLVYDWPSGISDGGLGNSFAQQLSPVQFGVPPALFVGNGITFEFEDNPGIEYEATLVDVTIFVDGFQSGDTSKWSSTVG